jgi:hypothetical protein
VQALGVELAPLAALCKRTFQPADSGIALLILSRLSSSLPIRRSSFRLFP